MVFASFATAIVGGNRISLFFSYYFLEANQMKERDYQARLIKRIKSEFPGCIVMKNDSSYIQGIPDLTVLYKDQWAMLECKISAAANKQPNQKYYVERANEMSYSAFIFPENEEWVFDELHSFFRS